MCQSPEAALQPQGGMERGRRATMRSWDFILCAVGRLQQELRQRGVRGMIFDLTLDFQRSLGNKKITVAKWTLITGELLGGS